jgi:hypothetical protein
MREGEESKVKTVLNAVWGSQSRGLDRGGTLATHLEVEVSETES